MFPGFVSTYRDKNNYVHLFFYPGNDNGNIIYKEIDLSKCPFKYTEIKYIDGSIDYKFYDKHISKLKCKLINTNNIDIVYKELNTN